MNKLVCIDLTSCLTHRSIKNRAIGASEYQFYNLLNELQSVMEIRCFNHHSSYEKVDSIEYNSYKTIETDPSDIVLVQRFYPTEPIILSKMAKNKTFVWIHDIPDFSIFLGNSAPLQLLYRNDINKFKNEVLLPILTNSSIHFVANSKHTYTLFNEFIQRYAGVTNYERCSVIYNALYSDEFDRTPVDKIPKRLIYASAWQKGIEKVIDIFRYVLARDPEYSLTLLSPGYDWGHFQNYAKQLQTEFGSKLLLLGPSTKADLCTAIKQSVCCLSSTFNETFGCVFAESCYLGTPVIADVRSGAVREIISDEFIVNYDSVESVWSKIQAVPSSIMVRPEFLSEPILLKWKSILR